MSNDEIKVNTPEDNNKELREEIEKTNQEFEENPYLNALPIDVSAVDEYLKDVPDSKDITTLQYKVEQAARIGINKPELYETIVKWLVMLALIVAGYGALMKFLPQAPQPDALKILDACKNVCASQIPTTIQAIANATNQTIKM